MSPLATYGSLGYLAPWALAPWAAWLLGLLASMGFGSLGYLAPWALAPWTAWLQMAPWAS